MSINLSPSKHYQERYKSGRVNFAGSIRNVVNALPHGETFTGSALGVFLLRCGLGEQVTRRPGAVESTLAGLAKREDTLVKDATNYYRVSRPEEKRDESTIEKRSKPDDNGAMDLKALNDLLYG